MAKAKRPWQKVHYATGLGEAVELLVSQGYQSARQMSIWYNAECGYNASTERQVIAARAAARKAGYIVYSPKHGWQTHPKWRQ